MIEIDFEDPKNNMYGVPSCPKCGSKFRYPWKLVEVEGERRASVECDECHECHYKEPGRFKREG